MSGNRANTWKKWIVALSAVVGLGLVILCLVALRSRPNTVAETRLVGQWMEIDPSTGADTGTHHTFTAQREYHDNVGFTGKWSIVDENLRVTYWVEDPPSKTRRLLPNRSLLVLKVRFDESSDRVEIGSPGQTIHAILVRRADI